MRTMNPTISLTDLTTTCVTCGGSGTRNPTALNRENWEVGRGPVLGISGPCQPRDARGWLLDPDRLEAAARVVALLRVAEHDFTLKYETTLKYKTDQAWAKVAVLAYLEPPT